MSAAALGAELRLGLNLLLPYPDADGNVVLTQVMRKVGTLHAYVHGTLHVHVHVHVQVHMHVYVHVLAPDYFSTLLLYYFTALLLYYFTTSPPYRCSPRVRQSRACNAPATTCCTARCSAAPPR